MWWKIIAVISLVLNVINFVMSSLVENDLRNLAHQHLYSQNDRIAAIQQRILKIEAEIYK